MYAQSSDSVRIEYTSELCAYIEAVPTCCAVHDHEGICRGLKNQRVREGSHMSVMRCRCSLQLSAQSQEARCDLEC